MASRIMLVAAAILISAPAYAGITVPMPEAGEGLLALGLAGGAYAFLRNRALRK